MKNVIFYFSGTGNNFAVASHIANILGETEVISILNLEGVFEKGAAYERIGFVFPVYYYHMPNIVKKIIDKVNYKPNQYIFGVIGHAGIKGMAMDELRQEINRCGGMLNAEFSVRMPGNYIVEYGAFPKLICNLLYKREQRKILEISSKIEKKETTSAIRPNIIAKLFNNKAIKKVNNFRNKDKEFNVNNTCTHCQICKNVCPVNNIEISDGKPIWKNECEQCMACIQWCPMQAINYSNKTQNRKRYTHLEVKVKDIMQAKGTI